MVGNCSRNMFKELYKLLINNLLYVIFTNFLLFLLLRQVAVNTQYFNIATINRILFRNNIRLLTNKAGLLTNKAGLFSPSAKGFAMFPATGHPPQEPATVPAPGGLPPRQPLY